MNAAAWLVCAALTGAAQAQAPGVGTAPVGRAPLGTAPSIVQPEVLPGVGNAQRAWQNWTLNCQGCHRPDGTGSETTAPSLAGTVAKFLAVPGGREYLGRVPGVATSPLSNSDLAEVMNWMIWRFDRAHVPATFTPFTAQELGELRSRPLRLEATPMRDDLLKKANAALPAAGT